MVDRYDPETEVEAQAGAGAAPSPESDASSRSERPERRDAPPRHQHVAERFEAVQSQETELAPALSLPNDAPRLTFPELSDSSRPRERERASAGPRIDSDLFGGTSRERHRDEVPAPSAPPESDLGAPATASSCEAAMARNKEEITMGGRRGPADITRDAYAAILENGRYLGGCSIPERSVFEICAAVQNGRAVGITVTANPRSPGLESCVRRAVSRLKFPSNPRLDVTRTRFDRAHR
jgi:hypothetical protein